MSQSVGITRIHRRIAMSLLSKVESLAGLPIYKWDPDSNVMRSQGTFSGEDSPFVTSAGLVTHLKTLADEKDLPVVYQDENGFFFSCMKNGDAFYFLGPVSVDTYTSSKKFLYQRMYRIANLKECYMTEMELGTFVNVICIVYEIITGEELESQALAKANYLNGEIESERRQFAGAAEIVENTGGRASHTHREKELVMECIRSGDVGGITEKISWLVRHSGTLSDDKFRHYYNLAIVVVTAATEAAIQGGVFPEKAYRYSDLVIQKISRCKKTEEVNHFIQQVALDCTRMVAENNRAKKSGYTDLCKNYISSHYREKITVSSIAEKIGISREHLTRTFRADTGQSMQEYIQKVRIERAMNMLKYSDLSLAEISDYVGFSTQSEMGRILKRITSLTPRQFREKWKPKEFATMSLEVD